ncbi:TonB-dependent receptor [Acinetobacter qingfengensis]|uniref:TonB-dependent receptor n=1 Tax=Acinetobacter qingfengensis TaxID=1262585 RepID=A0A1E7QXK5_9GAMM|nr:TonB-dependent receptor [Acinetobacter qingfengensis]KAA8731705.1 TonB-dependent receptor [Acinetobacter qingfengensis]OEY91804.1 TonB-dependent receptor [Acinetobacter qingfengensis]
MQFKQNTLWIAVASTLFSTFSIANDEISQQVTKVHQLQAITVTAHPLNPNQNDFANAVNVVEKEQLSQGSATLGDALNGKPGINSDNFGPGASRPVIRGQTAPRVKVLTDSSETMDASQISPDHAATVDPVLATRIEVLRGPSTLLYGGGAIGGVVNVLDEKIPTRMPENGVEGEVHLRGNTNTNEKLGAAGITVGLGDQFALRLEGDHREADNYQVSGYSHEGEKEKRVDGTWNKGQNASIGLSWIGEKGYVGLAYTDRQDKYALPGHSHEYESCHLHDLSLHCGAHDDESGHDHDHEHENAPWVDLKSKRVDLRAEYLQPFSGIEKIRARASYTDYQHQEIEDGEAATTFKNKGYDGRLEFVHQPLAGWEGVFGLQYAHSEFDNIGEEKFLPKSTTENLAAFLIEHYQWNDLHFELGGRVEKQTVDTDESDYKDFDDTAFSASGAMTWEFIPNYVTSLSLSYAERLPNAQELYANGVHLATNTYELGDQNLGKEKSKNLELGLRKVDGDLTFAVNAFYNQVDDYIYGHTLAHYENFRLIQYRQADVNFYGAEAEVKYQFTPMYSTKVFADHVRAELDQGGNLPRIPATRAGIRFDADFLDGIHGGVEYVHGFKQNKIADFEEVTDAYNLVNLDVSYDKSLNKKLSYQVYLQAKNLLDETYYNHASYLSTIPQMGRNFTAGIRFRF